MQIIHELSAENEELKDELEQATSVAANVDGTDRCY